MESIEKIPTPSGSESFSKFPEYFSRVIYIRPGKHNFINDQGFWFNKNIRTIHFRSRETQTIFFRLFVIRGGDDGAAKTKWKKFSFIE